MSSPEAGKYPVLKNKRGYVRVERQKGIGMAHRLLESDLPVKQKKRTWISYIPKMEGRFGLSLYFGGKEYFLGLSVNDTVKEQVIRKRSVVVPKGEAKVLSMDQE